MREIKFRGWDDEINGYIYGETILFQEFNQKWVMQVDNELGEEWIYIDEPQQYTGLKDKNGKEIYEGDIINCYAREDYAIEIGVKSEIKLVATGEVIWESPECGFCIKGCEPTFLGWYEEFEIIGNIYENPELLNQQQ